MSRKLACPVLRMRRLRTRPRWLSFSVAELGFRLGPYVYLFYCDCDFPEVFWVSLTPDLLDYKSQGRFYAVDGWLVFPAPPPCLPAACISWFFLLQVTETQLRLPKHWAELAAHRTAQPELLWRKSGIQAGSSAGSLPLLLLVLPSSSPTPVSALSSVLPLSFTTQAISPQRGRDDGSQ